jgi:hypothetical protein
MQGAIMLGILLLPFKLVWGVLTWVLNLSGRFIAILIGLVSMVVGVLLTITIIGGIVGIPLFIFGFMLILRGLF